MIDNNDQDKLKKALVDYLSPIEWKYFVSVNFREPNSPKDYRNDLFECVNLNTKLNDYLLSFFNSNRNRTNFYPISYTLEKGKFAGDNGWYHTHIIIGNIKPERFFCSKQGRFFLSKDNIQSPEEIDFDVASKFLEKALRSAQYNRYPVVEECRSAINIKEVFDICGLAEYLGKTGFDSLDHANTSLYFKHLKQREKKPLCIPKGPSRHPKSVSMSKEIINI